MIKVSDSFFSRAAKITGSGVSGQCQLSQEVLACGNPPAVRGSPDPARDRPQVSPHRHIMVARQFRWADGDLRSTYVRGRETRAQRGADGDPRTARGPAISLGRMETCGRPMCGVGRPAHSAGHGGVRFGFALIDPLAGQAGGPRCATPRVRVRRMSCWRLFDFSADPSGSSRRDRKNESQLSGLGCWLPTRRDL